MAPLKLLKILTCGLGKSSAGKEGDSQGIHGKKRQYGKGKETKPPNPERVQQSSNQHGCLPPDDKSPVTEPALLPTKAVKQDAFTSVFPGDPTMPPRNTSRPPFGMGMSQSKHKDLWDEAYKKLESENPNLFKKYTRYVVAIEDIQQEEMTYDIDQLENDQRELHLASLIKKRVQKIREEEWPTATLVYKKTVGMVLFAKNFIAETASSEPHAALAWAGVSMLLPVSGRFS